jgi:hypothetical protein
MKVKPVPAGRKQKSGSVLPLFNEKFPVYAASARGKSPPVYAKT